MLVWPPSPKNVLRIAVSVCLVGAFLAMLASLPKPGPYGAREVRLRELSGYLFTSMFAFLLLYIEHAWVERVRKRELDRRLAYVESLGCVAIVAAGTLSLLYAAATQDGMLLPEKLQANLLLVLCAYGEAAFLAAVIGSYLRPAKPTAITTEASAVSSARAPEPQHAKIQSDWSQWIRWPNSAARAFAITGAAIAAIGLYFVWSKPAWLLPIAFYDHIGTLPAGLVFTVAAVPFVVFTALYRIAETRYNAKFRSSSTQLHMVCALLSTLEILRVYVIWAYSNSGSTASPLTFDDLNGVFALVFLTAIIFIWNLARSSTRAQAPRPQLERSL
jgi:hypothetical protein